MRLGVVVGTVVSTHKADSLVGCKLLIVSNLNAKGELTGNEEVAVDLFGAGIGEKVLLCSGSSARSLFDSKVPIDLAVVGIVDDIELNH